MTRVRQIVRRLWAIAPVLVMACDGQSPNAGRVRHPTAENEVPRDSLVATISYADSVDTGRLGKLAGLQRRSMRVSSKRQLVTDCMRGQTSRGSWPSVTAISGGPRPSPTRG